MVCLTLRQKFDTIETQPPRRRDIMKTLKRAFENLFTSATSEEKESRAVYREWQRERQAAAQFGASHVAEIDAIFSRHGY